MHASSPSNVVLRAAGLTKRFGGVVAIDSVDFSLEKGQALGLIGPNGAGKSTLVGLLSGAHRKTAGSIELAGVEIGSKSPEEIARMGMGRTHQIPKPFDGMTVLENLLLGQLYGARTPRYSDAVERSHSILARTGLAAFAHAPAHSLPLLRRKRLELARALSIAPKILLLDEIGAGLVASEVRELIELIVSLRQEVQAMLIVEHVLDVIRACCDRALVLDWGKKIAEGTPDEVFRDPRVAAAYLGKRDATSAGSPVGAQPPATRASGKESRTFDGPVLLEVKDLAAGYGSFRALSQMSLEVRAGEVVALLGVNGAGKTTTARAICGMVRPTSGQVFWKGQRIDGLPPYRMVGLGIAHCMEGRRIFGELTVEENLLLGGRAAPSRTEQKARLASMYELFDILFQKRNVGGKSLSGGQQQMLAIARALMSKPELVIFDEISLGLAPIAVDRLYDALARVAQSGVSLLIIEQNVERGLALADRAYVVEKGAIAMSGTSDEVHRDARLRSLYVG